MVRIALLSIVCLTGCLTVRSATSPNYADGPAAVTEVADDRIQEASGIAASRRYPGCYYVHNDSGDAARVFLIDRTGQTRLTINLKGAGAVDCEDIAIAPGATTGSFDVCLADIGDNRAKRSHVTIYRFPEPAGGDATGATIEVTPTVYPCRYAGGAANAETFAVHPATGDGYILTKTEDGHSDVYKLPAPWKTGAIVELACVRRIELPLAPPLGRILTAGDISTDGLRLAVRCYLDGWEWQMPADAGSDAFERIFDAPPTRLRLAAEVQGEGLCYSADGRAILTIAEGKHPTLFELLPAETPQTQPSGR